MVQRIDIGTRMSQVSVHNGTAYIAGQIANNPNATIKEQTGEVLKKIDVLLEKAGLSKSDLLLVNVFLPNITDFDAMNIVYDAWVDPANPPVRACIEARLANPNLRVEVTAIAAVQSE